MLENLAQYYSNLVLASLVRREEEPASRARSRPPLFPRQARSRARQRPRALGKRGVAGCGLACCSWGRGGTGEAGSTRGLPPAPLSRSAGGSSTGDSTESRGVYCRNISLWVPEFLWGQPECFYTGQIIFVGAEGPRGLVCSTEIAGRRQWELNMQQRPGLRSRLHHSFSNAQAMEQEPGLQVRAGHCAAAKLLPRGAKERARAQTRGRNGALQSQPDPGRSLLCAPLPRCLARYGTSSTAVWMGAEAEADGTAQPRARGAVPRAHTVSTPLCPTQHRAGVQPLGAFLTGRSLRLRRPLLKAGL